MRLTTKGRFAVTAMIDLAMHHHEGPVSLACISQRQKISLSYLEQLFGKLRRSNLVNSVRGPGGGYDLARLATAITVADIIVAVNEPLDATRCGGKGGCQEHNGEGVCMTHELWTTLNAKMLEYLESVSLQNLVDQQQKRLLITESVYFPFAREEKLQPKDIMLQSTSISTGVKQSLVKPALPKEGYQG